MSARHTPRTQAPVSPLMCALPSAAGFVVGGTTGHPPMDRQAWAPAGRPREQVHPCSGAPWPTGHPRQLAASWLHCSVSPQQITSTPTLCFCIIEQRWRRVSPPPRPQCGLQAPGKPVRGLCCRRAIQARAGTQGTWPVGGMERAGAGSQEPGSGLRSALDSPRLRFRCGSCHLPGPLLRAGDTPGKETDKAPAQEPHPGGETQTVMCVPSLFSCVPTLCDPMGCSPPGSSAHGILQARILEWVAT